MKKRLLVGKIIGKGNIRVKEAIMADGTKTIEQVKSSNKPVVNNVVNNIDVIEDALSLEERAFNYITRVATVNHSTFTIMFDFEGHVVEMAVIDNYVVDVRIDSMIPMWMDKRYREFVRYR